MAQQLSLYYFSMFFFVGGLYYANQYIDNKSRPVPAADSKKTATPVAITLCTASIRR